MRSKGESLVTSEWILENLQQNPLIVEHSPTLVPPRKKDPCGEELNITDGSISLKHLRGERTLTPDRINIVDCTSSCDTFFAYCL
jgi:hypothetical protein